MVWRNLILRVALFAKYRIRTPNILPTTIGLQEEPGRILRAAYDNLFIGGIGGGGRGETGKRGGGGMCGLYYLSSVLIRLFE